MTDWRHKHTYKSPKKREPPFLRPVNLLRHSPRPHSQVHLRPPAAPPVRVSHQPAAPGLQTSDWARERARRKGARVSSSGSTVKWREHTGGEAKTRREIHEEEGAPRACPSFMERGSALRSAPFLAPPPFWQLSKKGRSPLPAASHRASTNRGRAAPPRLRHTPRRKQAGKIRAPLGTPVVSFREARW